MEIIEKWDESSVYNVPNIVNEIFHIVNAYGGQILKSWKCKRKLNLSFSPVC